jgi:hypothetical protein
MLSSNSDFQRLSQTALSRSRFLRLHHSAIDSTISYVKRAKDIHAASADAKTYSERLKAAFPDRRQAAWVDFSASLLYPAPG